MAGDPRGHTDVWLPMAYWTFRNAGSEYRAAYRYSAENVERLRANVGDPKAAVHIIGGIGDTSSATDYQGMQRGGRVNSAADRHVGLRLQHDDIIGVAILGVANRLLTIDVCR